MARGANQSTCTKYATVLLCDALSIIKSGRVSDGVSLIHRALSLLPDVDMDEQRKSEFIDKQSRRGIAA